MSATASGLVELPAQAAWRHQGSREGFEVAFFRHRNDGYTAVGQVNAVDDGQAWALAYRISFDDAWVTREARISSICGDRDSAIELAADGHGRWFVDRAHAPHLDGCLDLDLEASVLTNALPVRRLQLRAGQAADVPAAYVRMPTLLVERLEQTYERLPDAAGTQRYVYAAPAFDFSAELRYDADGLLIDYPGIGSRLA